MPWPSSRKSAPGRIALAFSAGIGLGIILVLVILDVMRPATARTDAQQPLVNTRTPLTGAYRAQVLNVIDGDTVEARVHVWMGQEVVTRIRLKDIDAPEMTGACGAERDLAVAARNRVAALVGNANVLLADVRPDKYFGRVVASIISIDGRDVGSILLGENLARPYRGGRRETWCPLP